MEANTLDSFLKSNPAATGVLAGVVTMAGQLAAQLELSPFGCRVVALCFALLLACYQVAIAQRRPHSESAFLVPIVAVILFTGGLGTNNLVYEVKAPTASTQRSAAATEHTSIARWVADGIVPAAYAQSNPPRNDKKDGGWKKW